MVDVDSVKDQNTNDRDSANSKNKLIVDDTNKKPSDDNISNPSSSPLPPPTPVKQTKEKSKKSKKKSEPLPPQGPDDRPSFRGPFGITTTSTIIWYIGICILFIVAFLSLVLSVLYYIPSRTTDSQIKLYGVAGSGTLAIITFVIVFLDCCNDSSQKDHEQEAMYRVLQAKEEREKEIALRRKRRIAEGKEVKSKPFVIQHQRSHKVSDEARSQSQSQSHHSHFPHPHIHGHHTHPVHNHPPTSYHHPFVCPICHDLHASGNARHHLTDIGVDTSDKFAPVRKSTKAVHKSTRDAQTEPKLWDAERGTQTDRTEGTQTSSMELSGMPGNVTEIIHETTIIKAPRSLLGTLKKSMAQQDSEIAMNRAMTDSHTISANIV